MNKSSYTPLYYKVFLTLMSLTKILCFIMLAGSCSVLTNIFICRINREGQKLADFWVSIIDRRTLFGTELATPFIPGWWSSAWACLYWVRQKYKSVAGTRNICRGDRAGVGLVTPRLFSLRAARLRDWQSTDNRFLARFSHR